MGTFNTIKNLLPKNAFVRSVLLLGGGTAGSQAILILCTPILTRLYSTEDFGLLAVYAALLSTLTIIASLRYELAVPIAQNDDEAAHVVILGLLIALVTSFVTLLAIIFFQTQIALMINAPAIANFLWLLPGSLFLLSSYQIFYYWALRVQAFPQIARTKLTQATSSMLVKIVGFGFGPLALLAGEVIGQTAGIVSLVSLAFRKLLYTLKSTRLEQIYNVAQRHYKFPLFATWSGLLNTVGTQLPPVLFAVLFSPAAAGIYALANRILSLPMKLLGQVIGNVFLAKAAEAQKEGTINILVAEIHEKLVQVAMPPSLVLAATGPELFAWAFGPEWKEAGVFAQLMAPMLYFQFILSPISTLFSVLDKQGQGMMLQGLMVLVRCLSLIVGTGLENLRLAVMLFSLGSSASYIVFLVWVVKISGNDWLILIKPTLHNLAIGLLLVSPLMLAILLKTNAFLLFGAMTITILLIVARYVTCLKKAWV